MRTRGHELEGLLELPSITDEAARRAVFRKAFAELARAASSWDGPPLEGIAPLALLRGVRIALDRGLLDDLDWLDPSAVAVALYELGTVLPPGFEQREVGRRLFARLHDGAAPVVAAVGTRMARASRTGLRGGSLRARIALLFSTSGSDPGVGGGSVAGAAGRSDAGALAYTLIRRRELAREFVVAPSTGSLAARRFAARIFERAATYAARRSSEGDDHAPRIFGSGTAASAFARLLADREPLVWRHAAIARGILAGVASPWWKAIIDDLHPRVSPTEWRRGATGLAAAVATSPERALRRARDLLASPLVGHDPGLPSTVAWALGPALEVEPESALELLSTAVDLDAAGVGEGLAPIARAIAATGPAGAALLSRVRAAMRARIDETEDRAERISLVASERELDPARALHDGVAAAVARALELFETSSARDAHAAALEALERAKESIARLEEANDPKQALVLLRDLDLGLLEAGALPDLLLLGGPRDEARRATLDDIHDRLGRWLLSHERQPASEVGTSARRLRALLHLLDEGGPTDDDDLRTPMIGARRTEAATVLLRRLAVDGKTPLHRTLCATLARALDAMVRDGTCEPTDLLVVIASGDTTPTDVATIAEASMDPDVEALLGAFAKAARIALGELPPVSTTGSSDPPPSRDAAKGFVEGPNGAPIEALLDLAAALGEDGSGRAEALRGGLVRLARALRAIDVAEARRAFEGADSIFDALSSAVVGYEQIASAARRRVLGIDPVASVERASVLRAHLGRLGDRDDAIARQAARAASAIVEEVLPVPLASVVRNVLSHAVTLPFEGAPGARPLEAAPEALPAWLGPRRTIGGFSVVKPLGGGAAASVFVAKRTEERRDPNAERFALKVPDYDGAAARTLSEQEFGELFRAEASALLGLPPHPNLARFVTFDLGAKPKPILVMELIEGPTLEGALAARDLGPTCGRAFSILDGVLGALEVMHGHGIGHLDLKPSNVILRRGEVPTLVDFGLAGRKLRPGCATGPYGAPEVWGVLPESFVGDPPPSAADVYAFGALAFELLTGVVLFDAPTEVATIARHVSHDGHPEGLDRIAAVRPLVELLEHTLRADPRARWTVPQIRAALRVVARVTSTFAWPLA